MTFLHSKAVRTTPWKGPSSLFPSLHSVGLLDGRPPLVRLCFFRRCSPPTIVPETLCQGRKIWQLQYSKLLMQRWTDGRSSRASLIYTPIPVSTPTQQSELDQHNRA